jgi:hypothetical protein
VHIGQIPPKSTRGKTPKPPKGGFKKSLVAWEIKLQIPLPLALTLIRFTNKDVENLIEKVIINIEMTVNKRLKVPLGGFRGKKLGVEKF